MSPWSPDCPGLHTTHYTTHAPLITKGPGNGNHSCVGWGRAGALITLSNNTQGGHGGQEGTQGKLKLIRNTGVFSVLKCSPGGATQVPDLSNIATRRTDSGS